MPVSEAQKRATARYRKRAIKTVAVTFSPKDYDMLDYLDSKGTRAGYIKDLIRRDMAQGAQSECDERDAREGSD